MFEHPIESIIQYTDKQGINYVACDPKAMDLEPWFNQMVESYGLFQLTQMFPYVTLQLNKDTGLLEPYKPVSYNSKVTNAFHLMLAKQRDEDPDQYATEYQMHLEQYFPDHDEPEVRDVGVDDPEKFILKDDEGFKIDNEKLPDAVSLKPVKDWHPNKDGNGNYMTGTYNPIAYPYPGGFNINPYTSGPTYLPNYMSYYNQYPF